MKRRKEPKPKTARLEPLNCIDLRGTSLPIRHIEVEIGTDEPIQLRSTEPPYEVVDSDSVRASKRKIVMSLADSKYKDNHVRLEPIPNDSNQTVYTLAIRHAKIGTQGYIDRRGSVWETVATGTLEELAEFCKPKEPSGG